MKAMDVRIAGIGLVTPLGVTANQTWHNLLAGHYVNDHCRAAGDWTDHRPAPPAPSHRSSPNQPPRAAQMALQAAREALAQAAWRLDDENPSSSAIVVGTSKGTVERWITPTLHMSSEACVTGGLLDPAGLADIASILAHHLHLHAAPRLTVSAACASGLVALIRAALLIQSRQARRALVVATEASVHPLFLGSFARLGVLPRQGVGCRPFDLHRDGFLMTEAAAAICLESDDGAPNKPGQSAGSHSDQNAATDSSSRKQAFTRILIDRLALAADATHLTAADPDGRVLRHVITQAAANAPLDLIHAHGTATATNDPIELAALEATLPRASPTPCLYSHKAALGHSLGAAGLVAVALNILAHQHNTVPGNVRTTNPLPTTNFTLSLTPITRPIRRSLALAAGFGGPTAAISLISQ
jgi:3-oxoacyl-[acyl-carrier-protein] synthase II